MNSASLFKDNAEGWTAGIRGPACRLRPIDLRARLRASPASRRSRRQRPLHPGAQPQRRPLHVLQETGRRTEGGCGIHSCPFPGSGDQRPGRSGRHRGFSRRERLCQSGSVHRRAPGARGRHRILQDEHRQGEPVQRGPVDGRSRARRPSGRDRGGVPHQIPRQLRQSGAGHCGRHRKAVADRRHRLRVRGSERLLLRRSHAPCTLTPAGTPGSGGSLLGVE